MGVIYKRHIYVLVHLTLSQIQQLMNWRIINMKKELVLKKPKKYFILDNKLIDIKVNTEMQYFEFYWNVKIETCQLKIRKAMQTYIDEKYEGLELIDDNLSPDDSHVVRYLNFLREDLIK